MIAQAIFVFLTIFVFKFYFSRFTLSRFLI